MQRLVYCHVFCKQKFKMKYRDAGKLIKFKNCSILRGHKIIKEDLWVRGGKIVNPENIFFDEQNFADKEIDCECALISPGFIDLQINGGFGIDFSQGVTQENLNKVSKGLLSHGVTAYCPTIVTSPHYVYHKVLPQLNKRNGSSDGAAILGAHLEGPFINPQKKGAHPPQFMKNFELGMAAIEEVYGSLENVAIITLAPELPGALNMIKELSKRGIIVSVGHSAADLSQGEAAVEKGASLITHLFNAMLPFHHRDPGLVGLLASDKVPHSKKVYYGIIADGVHTHPAALRIAYRTDPKGLVLVTDAVSALGFEEGRHLIGQMDVEIRGGRALVAGTDTLCGSIATMNDSVRFFKGATNCSTVEALEAATLHPALALGIADRKGVLDFGADADFVFLDNDLKLLSTWIAGECVYCRSNV